MPILNIVVDSDTVLIKPSDISGLRTATLLVRDLGSFASERSLTNLQTLGYEPDEHDPGRPGIMRILLIYQGKRESDRHFWSRLFPPVYGCPASSVRHRPVHRICEFCHEFRVLW